MFRMRNRGGRLFELSKEDYEKKLENIKKRNEQITLRRKLREQKQSALRLPKVETSKVLAVYLFSLLNAVIIYAMVAMWRFADLTYLGVLVSDIAAQVVIYAIYCLKAYHGKKQEEALKLEKEKFGIITGNETEEPDSSAVG